MRLKTRTNFKISWTSNFGSKIWAKLQAKPNFSSQFLRASEILKFAKNSKFIFKICDLNFKNLWASMLRL